MPVWHEYLNTTVRNKCGNNWKGQGSRASSALLHFRSRACRLMPTDRLIDNLASIRVDRRIHPTRRKRAAPCKIDNKYPTRSNRRDRSNFSLFHLCDLFFCPSKFASKKAERISSCCEQKLSGAAMASGKGEYVNGGNRYFVITDR